jgi:hypothetical protein
MTLRFIDWIWHIRGTLTLAPEQSGEEAFERLGPLFRQSGTSHQRGTDTLTFRKRDQAAQDKMSVFDGGTLRIEQAPAGTVLRWHLTSRALLACFLAPLLFLALGQLTVTLGKFDKAPAEAPKHPDKKDATPPMNPIDKFLGAPAPDKPDPKKADKDDHKSKKYSPTSAYVFAGIFAVLYLVGRVLEDRLIRRQFARRLLVAS